jgi:MiaB/RimO family radical SAM methylthiotransferase
LLSRHPMDREWPTAESSFLPPPVALEGASGKTRAFLKIQEGCNAFCTYCIIPYGRGPSRSLKSRQVVEQARLLVAQGVRELVITGTNIGDYGIDWGMDPAVALEDLFARILGETGLERLRVGSLDPSEISEPLLRLMERDPRFCPHLHVSLQAAQGRILRLMKRKYGMEQVRLTLERIAALPAPPGGAFVGMDVITGFPGETEEEFEQGYQALTSLPWSRLHVFPYSEREGTPATRLPGSVPLHVRAERAKRLGTLSLERVKRHAERALRECQSLGQPMRGILLEKPSAKAPVGVEPIPGMLWANGYTPHYLRVFCPLPESLALASRNQIVEAFPVSVLTDGAQGDAALLACPRNSE